MVQPQPTGFEINGKSLYRHREWYYCCCLNERKADAPHEYSKVFIHKWTQFFIICTLFLRISLEANNKPKTWNKFFREEFSENVCVYFIEEEDSSTKRHFRDWISHDVDFYFSRSLSCLFGLPVCLFLFLQFFFGWCGIHPESSPETKDALKDVDFYFLFVISFFYCLIKLLSRGNEEKE